MDNFWENRYKSGGNSGLGSYGEYAKHKADVINKYIADFKIKTISDFGCGDGNQIGLFVGYVKYFGYDISSHILDVCRSNHQKNKNMEFCNEISELPISELTLSLDVIYHIIDQEDFETYLHKLFNKSSKYVLIYSTNTNKNVGEADHIFHRKFTDWVGIYCRDFKLIEEIDNNLNISAKFYLYSKI